MTKNMLQLSDLGKLCFTPKKWQKIPIISSLKIKQVAAASSSRSLDLSFLDLFFLPRSLSFWKPLSPHQPTLSMQPRWPYPPPLPLMLLRESQPCRNLIQSFAQWSSMPELADWMPKAISMPKAEKSFDSWNVFRFLSMTFNFIRRRSMSLDYIWWQQSTTLRQWVEPAESLFGLTCFRCRNSIGF